MGKVRPSATAGDMRRCLNRAERGRRASRELLMEQNPSQDLTSAMLDAVGLFEALGIGYALVGGLAAMYYGRARFTEDVDFVAEPGHEGQLGQHDEMMRKYRFDPGCTWKLYHDSGIEIDIWKDEHAGEIVGRAVEAQMAERSVKVVEVHDLIAMKLRANRLQDDYDISEILKRSPVNQDVLRQRVTDEQLAHYREIERRTA